MKEWSNEGMRDRPRICKRVVDHLGFFRVTIAALLTIRCHGYLETMWSPPLRQIFENRLIFFKTSRAVYTQSQIFEHFSVTLLGTFASSKIGWPWSWGKLASTWLALLTWSSAKTFAASRSSDWPLKIQYCTQMVWLGHIHWWSLSAPIRARQAAVKLQ